MSQGGMGLGRYLMRWRRLGRPARLYLLHVALLTSNLAVSALFYNLAILALGYPRSFLGQLYSLSIAVAALLSVPLWWLAARVGLRRALIGSAALQALSTLIVALWPAAAALLLASALTGAAAVLFQVSSPPFMMRHSDEASRDHLFSANAAINIGLAGVGSLLAGGLPAGLAGLLGGGPESALAYRAAFLVAGAGLVLSLIPLLLIAPDQVSARSTPGPALPPAARQSFVSRLVQGVPPSWRSLARHPGPLLRLLVAPLLISCGAALLLPFLNLFFKERFALADTSLGLIFATLGITTGLAALGGPALSLRIGKIKTVVLSQALSIPFLLALGFTPLLGLAIGAALLRGALFNMGTPLYDAFAMERTEEEARPLVMGLINGTYSIGYIVAPVLSGLVQQRYGFGPLFLATAMCYTLAVLANYWLFVRPGSLDEQLAA